MGGFSLLFAAVGSVIFGLWLAFEVWIRRAPVEDLAFTTKEGRGGGERSYYQVRVQVPSSHQINDKWVWISDKQYESLEDAHMMPAHVRRSGDRTFLRGVPQPVVIDSEFPVCRKGASAKCPQHRHISANLGLSQTDRQ